ncbi:MAG: RNA polymerase sigma factor [Candidatus Kapaibacteriota bacterium]
MVDFKKYNDNELANLILSKDKKIARPAFDELYRRYASSIYTYCVKMVTNRDEAQDILQDTFTNVFERLKTKKEPIENIAAYLFKTAKNLCINTKNRDNVKKLKVDASKYVTYQESLESKERQEWLEAALNELPIHQKEIIILKEFMNLSYNEIAVVLDIPRSSVGVMLLRAKSKLKDILSPIINDLQEKEKEIENYGIK